jgi:hypothetical protein
LAPIQGPKPGLDTSDIVFIARNDASVGGQARRFWEQFGLIGVGGEG